MDKSLAGLIGAASLLAIPAQAATPEAATAAPPTYQEAMHLTSYADLLKPIPNASTLLKQSETGGAAEAGTHATVEPVQFWVQIGPRHHWYHHHHHHHYRDYWYGRRHHHHHHHQT